MKKIILVFILLFPLFLLAQKQINVKKYMQEGDNFLSVLDFRTAQEIFELVLKQEPDNLDANFKMGFCYLNLTHREKSLGFFQKVHKANPIYVTNLVEVMVAHPKYVNTLDFLLGQAHHYNNLFKEAIRFYEKAKQKYKTDLAEPKVLKNKSLYAQTQVKIKECEKKIQECNYGEEYITSPVNSQIDNIGNTINGKFSDYAPVVSADENTMVFTSRREGSTGGNIDRADGRFFEDIYIASKKNGTWNAPQNVGNPINTKYHDASIALSADGKQIFIYRDNNHGTGDIYISRLNPDGRWGSPKSLGDNINTEFHEASVSISSDGNTVYFSSNRPGGYGDLDIYMSKKEANGEWGKAVNLGPNINTEYEDDAPFISFDSQHLYFSSKGHATMGDFDVFRSAWENNEWTKPKNLGFPINTADNDIYFVLSADEKTGYYASAKEGGYGEKDIYTIRMPEREAPDLVKNTPEIDIPAPKFKIEIVHREEKKPKLILRGTIRDKETKQALEANISLSILKTGDNFQNLTSEADNGDYSSTQVKWSENYIISVQKEGYLFHSESFAIPNEGAENEEVIVDIDLESVKVGAKINLVIFFDFDKAHLRPESNAELKRLLDFMQKHPAVKVEIAGHTDNIGTDQKNLILSDRRAKTVVDYLLENNISEERMRYVGYGFHKPIAPNQNTDGKDNPQGRQLNRRTECVVTAIK